jgi:hypothetical protein
MDLPRFSPETIKHDFGGLPMPPEGRRFASLSIKAYAAQGA